MCLLGFSMFFFGIQKIPKDSQVTKLSRWKVVLWPLSSKDLPFDSGRISTFQTEDLGFKHASRQGYNANCVCVGFGCVDYIYIYMTYIYISSCIIWLRDELCHYVNTPHDLEDCLHIK